MALALVIAGAQASARSRASRVEAPAGRRELSIVPMEDDFHASLADAILEKQVPVTVVDSGRSRAHRAQPQGGPRTERRQGGARAIHTSSRPLYTRALTIRGAQARFATTRWTVVLAAAEGVSPGAEQALAVLCEAYWYPLYGFLRGMGYSQDAAQDLTQGFFVRLLDQDRRVLRLADPGRGRFRSFLLASLKHFAANERERAAALKRGGGVELRSLDFEWAEGRFRLEPSTEETPERVFDRHWALTVLDRALAEVRERATEGGRLEHFELLKVFLTGERPQIDYAATGARLGMSSGAVKVAVHRLRRQFRDAVRDEIRQTVSSPDEVEDELRYLWSAVAR